MARPLTRLETTRLVRELQSLLNLIEIGELDASSGMVHRIEGAIKALQVVLGEAEESDLL